MPDESIPCPKCGLEYCHVYFVEAWKDEEGRKGARIYIECENDHGWILVLFNYKGQLRLKTEAWTDKPAL